MREKIIHIEAYILAGGKSSRMGTDKGLILFKGKPLIEKVIEQLQPLFKKIIIVSNNPEYEKFGLEVIQDLIKDIGPAGGIYTALKHTKSDGILVVGCDMPFITNEAVQAILGNSVNQQITLFLNQGKIQPLFGFYPRTCLQKWEQLIERGMIKLQEMVTHFNLLKIDFINDPAVNDLLFTNINDRTDLDKALQQLSNGD